MLSDLHDSIRAMLRAALGVGDDLAVLFGPPNRAAESPARPVVSLWLADVREDQRSRASDWSATRDNTGLVTGRRPPYRHYRVTYLVTAWADDDSTENDLLGEMLRDVGSYIALPDCCRRGWLVEDHSPVPLELANPPYSISEGWGVWAALNMAARASIHLAVTVPLRSSEFAAAAPAVEGRRLSTGLSKPQHGRAVHEALVRTEARRK